MSSAPTIQVNFSKVANFCNENAYDTLHGVGDAAVVLAKLVGKYVPARFAAVDTAQLQTSLSAYSEVLSLTALPILLKRTLKLDDFQPFFELGAAFSTAANFLARQNVISLGERVAKLCSHAPKLDVAAKVVGLWSALARANAEYDDSKHGTGKEGKNTYVRETIAAKMEAFQYSLGLAGAYFGKTTLGTACKVGSVAAQLLAYSARR